MQVVKHIMSFGIAILVTVLAAMPACAQSEEKSSVDENIQAYSSAGEKRFPQVEIAHSFKPPGESNVRSSFKLADGVALMGTEETGDVFKTTDGGKNWAKTVDGGDEWSIQDIRNYIRADDGRIYATTSEPALVLCSDDEGETFDIVARAKSSRTVALTQLESGEILVGLRRSANNKISILRSVDHFKTFDTIVLDDKLPRQNTTCLMGLGDGVVVCGVGYEESGKIFRSTDAGLTWTQTAELTEARDVMNFFKVGKKVFVLTSGIATIFSSSDYGTTWSKHAQIWEKGFLGQHGVLQHNSKTFHLLAATDQRAKVKRHVLLISDDEAETWHEWIELQTDVSGGASNLAVIDNDTIVVGTGNHSVQGFVHTLKVN
jgi:photosystem II stability/assembly factor-like uncharacterized protein